MIFAVNWHLNEMNSYPIDIILPELKLAVQNGPSVIVHAPPGAGKTTRVKLGDVGSYGALFTDFV